MNKGAVFKYILLGSLVLSCAPDVFAATKAPVKKQKTVADVLVKYKDTDNRGKNLKINKYSLIFPTTKENQPVAPARNIKKVKPPGTVSFFLEGDQSEVQIERLLDQQIDELYKINRKFSKSPERGELWLRLGELYVEKAKLMDFRAQDEFDKKLQEWDAKGQKGPRPKINSGLPKILTKRLSNYTTGTSKIFLIATRRIRHYFS